MNKMNKTEIHTVLDKIKRGDVVKVTLLSEVDRVNGKYINSPLFLLRCGNGDLSYKLEDAFSVENLGQPEPPTPLESLEVRVRELTREVEYLRSLRPLGPPYYPLGNNPLPITQPTTTYSPTTAK